MKAAGASGFRVLVADPPWKFGDKLPGTSRGAEKNYSCMSTDEICDFPIPPMLADSVLFLWRVASMQEDALRVGKAWGFTQKTEIVWRKETKAGKRHFGMGRIVRAEHEVCLVFTRGRITSEVLAHNIRSVFDAQVDGDERFNELVSGMFTASYTTHSQKPDEFFEIVESLFNGPYVEIFARGRPRPKWLKLGNQVEEA